MPDLDLFVFLELVALRPVGLDSGQLFSYRLSCVRLSVLDIVWNIPSDAPSKSSFFLFAKIYWNGRRF